MDVDRRPRQDAGSFPQPQVSVWVSLGRIDGSGLDRLCSIHLGQLNLGVDMDAFLHPRVDPTPFKLAICAVVLVHEVYITRCTEARVSGQCLAVNPHKNRTTGGLMGPGFGMAGLKGVTGWPRMAFLEAMAFSQF